MAENALKRVERMLPGQAICPFDFFNYKGFYDPQLQEEGEYAARLNAQPVVAYVAANAVNRGVRLWFPPGSMSNGERAYELVEDSERKVRQSVKLHKGESQLTTQRLKHMVAGSELNSRTILPNRIQNAGINAAAHGLRVGYGVMGVIGPEGAWRSARSDNALSQGATFQDVIFERWWGPRVLDSAGMVLGGDHAYSRYANVEEVLADQIQCGLLDDYREHIGPGRAYDIVDLQGQHITLADRAWETAKHIVDVVERGFITDLAVAALVARFQIDDWLRVRDASPIDPRKLHPVLAERSLEEFARMDRLKELMLPYLSAKCTAWMPYRQHPHLERYFENNILQCSSDIADENVAALKAELFSYQPRGGFVHPRYQQPENQGAIKQAFALSSAPARPVLRDDRYFAPRSRLFEDNQFSKLSLWEQAGLRFILPVMESVELPASTPKRYMYLCDPKGGEMAAQWADKHGILWLKEAQSAEKSSNKNGFLQKVMIPNEKRARAVLKKMNADSTLKNHGIGNVYGTVDLLDIRHAAMEKREFVAASGASRYSSRAHLALQVEFFNRNAEGLILGKDWQNHPHHVQVVVEAVKNAVGLVDRGYDGGKFKMEILEYSPDDSQNPYKKIDLHHLIETLGMTVLSYLEQTPPVPDRAAYVACARLLEISDKLVDPGRMNIVMKENSQTGLVASEEVIDWRNVDPDFYRFFYEDPEKAESLTATRPGKEVSLRDRLRGKIMDNILQIGFEPEDLKDLSPDYETAFIKAGGFDALQRYKRRPSDGRHLIADSPT